MYHKLFDCYLTSDKLYFSWIYDENKLIINKSYKKKEAYGMLINVLYATKSIR